MFKKISMALVILGLTSQSFAGTPLTSRQAFYRYAHDGNLAALKKLNSLGNSIDSIDEYGNSALCESIHRQDYLAFALLKRVGANIKHPCINQIPPKTIQTFDQNYTRWANTINSPKQISLPSQNQTLQPETRPIAVAKNSKRALGIANIPKTTGLSTSAVVSIGAGAALVAGSVALAVGGGGHSGSSSNKCSEYANYSTSVSIPGCTLTAPVCTNGKTTYYQCTSCSAGYKPGENGKCDADDCTTYASYSTSSSIEHCAITGVVCQTGTTQYYQCVVNCDEGWSLDDTGRCSINGCESYTSYPTNPTIEGCSGAGSLVCRKGSESTYYRCTNCDEENGWVNGSNGICVGAECSGYNLTDCQTDKAECSSCLSAGNLKYKIDSCKGNWSGEDCTNCPLTGHVDTDTCSCEESYVQEGNACNTCNADAGYELEGDTCLNKCSSYSSYSTDSTIEGCSVATASVCSSGNLSYYQCSSCDETAGWIPTENGKCQAADCSGYAETQISNCQTTAECKTGGNTRYKCTACEEGWSLSNNGLSCVENGSCSGQTTPFSNCAIDLEICKRGNVTYYSCPVCQRGYGGDTCSECEDGYKMEGGKCIMDMGCVSGISAWPQEIASAHCAEGKVTSCANDLYQCSECLSDSGYIMRNGKCVHAIEPEGTKIYAKKANINANNTTSSIPLINNDASITDIYGLYGSSETKGANADASTSANSSISIFNGTQETPIHANIYALTTSESSQIYGAYGNGGNAQNDISIVNYGNGNVYGEYTTGKADGAKTASTNGGTIKNTISIFNTGTGDVHGIFGGTTVSGAGNSNASNSITLINNGSGNVFGLSNNSANDVYGATNTQTNAAYRAQNTINIISIGDTNTEIYGEKSLGVAEGAYSSNSAASENTINISADYVKSLYGIYSTSYAYGAHSTKEGNTNNSITLGNKTNENHSIINVSDTLAAIRASNYIRGAYSYDTGNSSNTINIYAIGSGNIYGLANFYSNANANEWAAYTDGSGNTTNAISIDYAGTGNVYGLYSANEASVTTYGAFSNNGIATNNITLNTTENPGITAGIYTKNNITGANAKEKDATNTVIIKNSGDGTEVVYGMRGQLNAKGAFADGAGKATNTITIEDNGTNNIYGLLTEGNYYAQAAETTAAGTAENNISITNHQNGSVFGVNAGTYVQGATASGTGTAINNIIIQNKNGSGSIYGLKAGTYAYGAVGTNSGTAENTISITNLGMGNVYGMYFQGTTESYGAYNTSTGNTKNTLSLTNTNGYTVYGMKGGNNFSGAYATNGIANNTITIVNNARTNTSVETAAGIYGMHTDTNGTLYGAKGHGTSSNTISITNKDGGNIYGIYGSNTATLNGAAGNNSTNTLNLINIGSGKVYGMVGKTITTSDSSTNSTNNINITTIGATKAVGLRGSNGTVTNAAGDTITINSLGENYTKGTETITAPEDHSQSIGIYAAKDTTVTNEGTITIKREAYTDGETTYTPTGTGGTAIGIYVEGDNSSNKNIINNGLIEISGVDSDNAYGIYVAGGTNVTVKNSGTIKINSVPVVEGPHSDMTKDSLNDTGHGIYFSEAGGTVINLGTLSVSGNLNASTINLTLAPNSKTNVENSFYGTATVDADLTMHDFKTVYTGTDMISARDTSGLNLVSGSALFDATLADNNRDIIMTMKGFDTATKNSSLAGFLSKNYTLGNNEAFYNKLKNFSDVSSLSSSLNKLTGKETLSRFSFEDLTMMRELNFDMNDKLFHKSEKHFSLAGSITPMAFKGDSGSHARYSLYNKREGNTSIGLGIAFTNIYSDNNNKSDGRDEAMYQLILPMGYKTHGLNLMTSPRIGYARGNYSRTGFDGASYDGTIEKRVFGLMNEARYPIALGKWRFEPSAEFNILGYQQKGHEDTKEFALRIQNQNTYSIEGGIGFYTTREEELNKDSTLKFTAGIAVYHEFADPYRIKVGMNGMEGAFTLQDENRSDNRAIIRTSIDLNHKDYAIYGSFISYIDREWRTNAKTGLKWNF